MRATASRLRARPVRTVGNEVAGSLLLLQCLANRPQRGAAAMLSAAPAILTRRPGPAGAAAAQGAAAGTVLLCTYPALVSNAPHRSYPLAPLCSLRCSALRFPLSSSCAGSAVRHSSPSPCTPGLCVVKAAAIVICWQQTFRPISRSREAVYSLLPAATREDMWSNQERSAPILPRRCCSARRLPHKRSA